MIIESKVVELINNNEFLNKITKSIWFAVNTRYDKYAVKMVASKHYENGIHSVWLSVGDPESMAVEDYLDRNWDYIDKVFHKYGAGVFHFGSNEVEKESIYDAYGNVNVEIMIREILNNVEEDFVTEDELREVWSKLIKGEELGFEVLECK
ncbi:hypothetical protein EBB07_28510 [Paenibacillaceae bacterium]|nr:hypothetical protein EBB07_28510 [Paenibacillaceae bacterium]